MVDEEFSSDKDKSEFNAALETLKAIRKIKNDLAVATISQDYDFKFRVLKAYFIELIGILGDEDEPEQRKRLRKITDNYYKYLDMKNKGKSHIPRSLIESFDDWDMELRNLEQKYGMVLPRKKDGFDATEK